MKFWLKVDVSGKVKLNDSQLSWVDEIKHLGSYINQSLSDNSYLDSQYKVSSCLGNVNKLIDKFGILAD